MFVKKNMEVNHDERVALCALNDIMGYEPNIAHGLLEKVGSALRLFEMGREGLDALLGPYSKYRDSFHAGLLDKYDRELSRARAAGAIFLTVKDPGYPELLMECEDAPVGLYIRSCSPPEEIFGRRPQIAVVGTRDISMYGREWCQRLVYGMAGCQHQPLIVSGFAYGTDIIAHSAALECGLPTVAVLPCGIDSVYPNAHRHWARRMEQTPGCALVTDYATGTTPIAINFLRRNRIIAGLSSATILVESRIKGGGLITTSFAFDYNRDVYALPGRIDDPRSQGCNNLIRSKIAEPIVDLDSFMASLGLGMLNRRSAASLETEIRRRYEGSMPPEELERVIATAVHIRKHRGSTVEEIAAQTGLPYSDVNQARGMLESDGFIECDLLQRCSIKAKKM